MIKLSTNQTQILSYLKSGLNVFITGSANTGKTTVLKEFCKVAESAIVCSYSPLGTLEILDKIVKNPFNILLSTYSSVDIPFELLVAKIIIIDDVQYLTVADFKSIYTIIKRAETNAAKALRYSRNGEIPYCAKKQIIIAGDFFRSPFDNQFLFNTDEWQRLNLQPCILTKNMIKQATVFVHNLEAVRIGDIKGLNLLASKSSHYRMKHSVYIYFNHDDSSARNAQKLTELGGELITYKVKGNSNYQQSICDNILPLRLGAQVIALIDGDNLKNYRRGSTGKVKDMQKDAILVEWENGKTSQITRHRWSICEYRYIKGKGENNRKLIVKEIGYIFQMPLKAAYSLTNDEIKNMLIDRAVISPANTKPGELYDALAKMRSPDGLFLKTRNLRLNVPEEIIIFYDSIGFNVKIDHRGGARKGAGRKLKFNTKSQVMRVPDYLIPLIKKLSVLPIDTIKELMEKWNKELN